MDNDDNGNQQHHWHSIIGLQQQHQHTSGGSMHPAPQQY